MVQHRFALERYEASGSVASLGPALLLTGTHIRLVAVVQLPEDDTVLVLVEGPDAATVLAAAHAADWRVDRLSPAVWLTPEEANQEKTCD